MTPDSNALLVEFFAGCPDLLFIASAEGALLHASNALREALGPAVERGETLTALVHPDDRAALAEAWSKLLASDEPVSFRVRLRDGSGAHWPLSCSARRSSDRGAVFGTLRAAPEVTEEELKTLRSKARMIDGIAEHLDDAVLWGLDRNAVCYYHEGKGLARVGLKPGHLVGANWFDVFGDESRRTGIDLHAWFDGTPHRHRDEFFGIHWDLWAIPLRDDRGEPGAGVLCLAFDVTETKRAEEELRTQLHQIEAQQKVIRDLSTPIIEVWDGVLTLPMVGTVDSVRTADVMDSLLSKIVEKQARYAILDLTGVEVVDTKVASHLIELVTAIRLLGAEGIVAGIKPNVAQTMVALGLDLSQLNTQRNLRAALNHAIRAMTRVQAPSVAAGPAPAHKPAP
ncbi:anti-anti-sigma factor [Sorangium cellulosum]|uniref:Anti-anti-sigma factor n=1 Tax=Sorangium cellulosum TaxID=56 RepID=A0A2L0F187_SORCE|nr:STAS domain-containing protein [Sorangium cellulosum]AUX45239.1 anti-anti-sigma factor [Sorangium cellulosum]